MSHKQEVVNFLTSRNISFRSEYRLRLGEGSSPLFDFLIPSKNLFIDVDEGSFDQEQNLRYQSRINIKRKLVEENRCIYVYIPFGENVVEKLSPYFD